MGFHLGIYDFQVDSCVSRKLNSIFSRMTDSHRHHIILFHENVIPLVITRILPSHLVETINFFGNIFILSSHYVFPLTSITMGHNHSNSNVVPTATYCLKHQKQPPSHQYHHHRRHCFHQPTLLRPQLPLLLLPSPLMVPPLSSPLSFPHHIESTIIHHCGHPRCCLYHCQPCHQ